MNATSPIQISLEEKRFLLETGLILRDAGRYEPSLAILDALVPLVDDRHLPLIAIGSVHFAQGNFDRAIECYESAVSHAPDHALAHAHLGEALAFARHLEEAALALDKAIQLDPAGQEGGNMARMVRRLLESGLLQ